MRGDFSAPLFWSEDGWVNLLDATRLEATSPEHLPKGSCGFVAWEKGKRMTTEFLITAADIRIAKIQVMEVVSSTAYEDSLDSAEAMGALARLKGISRDDNPFSGKGADEYFMWDVGWVEVDDSKAK
jgi:hypothetical protein